MVGIYAAVLIAQGAARQLLLLGLFLRLPGLINTFGVHLLHYLNNISVVWHATGTFALVIAILAKAPTHQSATFVFKTFVDNTGAEGNGWGDRASHAYVVIIG